MTALVPTVLVLSSVLIACHADRVPTDETTLDKYARRIKQSPNYSGGRFVNEVTTRTLEIDKLWMAVSDNLAPGQDQRPPKPLPMVPVDLLDIESATETSVVWLGHSTVLIRIDGSYILTDPVFDPAVRHAVGSTTRFQPSPLKREDLPVIDLVLISHDHFDHLEQSTVEYLSATGSVFLVPLGVGRHLRQWGVPDSQIVELDWWESTVVDSLEISCTPARHFSGRNLDEFNKTLWSSWVVAGSRTLLFFAGDTGYSDHFKEIGARFGPFDLTLLPIGASDAAWPDIHIGPEEALYAHQTVGGKALLPIHWGTFDLAAHAWDDPILRLVQADLSDKIVLLTPRLGEIVRPKQSYGTNHWWEGLD